MKKKEIRQGSEKVSIVFQEIAKKKKNEGQFYTGSNYVSCINKFVSFLGESTESFYLADLDKNKVEEYILWLEKKHSDKAQTVDFYFRGLRALFNIAVKKKEYIDLNLPNPFIGLRIQKKATVKRALPLKMLSKLFDAELGLSLSDSQRQSLDILLISLYCRGMVFHDMYDLKWSMIDEAWQIEYRRSKTGQAICLAVPKEAQEIMLRYKLPDNSYVFPFLREKKDKTFLCEKSALRRINRHAIIIGKILHLPFKLTSYVMRHSWATLMLEAGKSVEIISQCMGHTSIRTTQIYLSSISTQKVDREVNDMLNRFIRPTKKKKRNHMASLPRPVN